VPVLGRGGSSPLSRTKLNLQIQKSLVSDSFLFCRFSDLLHKFKSSLAAFNFGLHDPVLDSIL
jgi:hypothetical protein